MSPRWKYVLLVVLAAAHAMAIPSRSVLGANVLPDLLAGNHSADRNAALWSQPAEPQTATTSAASHWIDDTSCSSACSVAPSCARWWFAADYLLVWANAETGPPLVSTNATVPPRPQAGVLGVGDTEVVAGGRLDEGGRSGVALSAGYWLDDCQFWGLQATWWYTGNPWDQLDTSWSSTGDPVLARPFLNVGSNAEDSQLVAYPGVVEGTVSASTGSDLRSAEALVSRNWLRGSRGRVDLLGGYRYLRFRDSVYIEEHLVSRIPLAFGATIDLYDRFDASNSFHGGEVGLLTTLERGCFQFDIITKLGIGNVQRRLLIDGMTVVTAQDGSQATTAGGLLALSSNMGRYEHDTFGLLPELNLRSRLDLTDQLSFNVGYTLLFLTNVYRAAAQIDRGIDPGLLNGGMPINDNTPENLARPALSLDRSTLCVQGLNVGMTVKY